MDASTVEVIFFLLVVSILVFGGILFLADIGRRNNRA